MMIHFSKLPKIMKFNFLSRRGKGGFLLILALLLQIVTANLLPLSSLINNVASAQAVPSLTWNSWDTTIQTGSPHATVTDTNGSQSATLELYESSNNNGVALGTEFDSFSAGNHPDGFNNLQTFYLQASSPQGNYPYIGKSTTGRGSEDGETNTPGNTGVNDLQIHPPENDHLAVAAFVAPSAGTYRVSNLATRGILPWFSGSTYKVFNSVGTQIASVEATSRAWATDSGSYDLGTLNTGDKIYFAVDRNGNFVGDAVEVSWTIEKLEEETTGDVSVTINTNEAGTKVVVDGNVQTMPYVLNTTSGETHSVYVPSPQTTNDGRTVNFGNWSDSGTQEHTITPTADTTLTATLDTPAVAAPTFKNGFEEGDTSAYTGIFVEPGNSLDVVNFNVRSGTRALQVTTDGVAPTAVVDKQFAPMNTMYLRTFIRLSPDFNVPAGTLFNAMVIKDKDLFRQLYLSIGPDNKIHPYFLDPESGGYCDPTLCGIGTTPGAVGPEIPRDNSWHEIQVRYTVDSEHGMMELWLDRNKISEFYEIDTGVAGVDDLGFISWGTFYSSAGVQGTVGFDDISFGTQFFTGGSEGFETEVVTGGLNIPTYATFAPDGRIFIGEQDGTIRVFKNGALLPDPLVVVPNVNQYQDRGLISLALDPDFENNGYIYVAHSYETDPTNIAGPKTARLVRFTVTGDTADLGSMDVILGNVVGTPANPSCENFAAGSDCIPSDAITHTIGQVKFGPDGYMYLSIGDGADDDTPLSMRAQNLDSLSGKILRMNADGTGVATNPFYNGDPNANRSKVWAYGFRNPFRWDFRTGATETTIYAGDVGRTDWEEIDAIKVGQNYGWPCLEANTALPGYQAYPHCVTLVNSGNSTPPVYTYPHPPGSAIVGGAFYTGSTYPEYQGKYFFGDYAQSKIWTMDVDANDVMVPGSVEEFPDQPDGPVQIFKGPNGDLYYISIFQGQLRRIQYLTTGLPPVVVASANVYSGTTPLTVNFSSAGSSDPEGQPLTYAWNFDDGATSTEANPTHEFTTEGDYAVRLTVTDVDGLARSSTIHVIAGNTPPEVTITTPEAGSLYGAGEVVNFTATALDPEDGVLPSSAFTWQVIMHHCEPITNTCHIHPYTTGTGNSGSFSGPDHGVDTYLELIVTARDSQNLAATNNVEINPRFTTVSLASSTPGLNLVLNGEEYVTPATVNVLSGGTNMAFAPSPQTLLGNTYNFSYWSNAGDQNHSFATSAPMTLTATYNAPAGQTFEWNSHDVSIQLGSPQAEVIDTTGVRSATVELYESANIDGVDQGLGFDLFSGSAHPDAFNALGTHVRRTSDTYPYIGKSTVARGQDGGEGNTPTPPNVFDLQMHTPNNDHLTVSAFTAPNDGSYTVSNLGVRKVMGWSSGVTYKIFDNDKNLIHSITTNSDLTWANDADVFDLGYLQAGDKIYFAVDRGTDFIGDGAEITWKVTMDEAAPQPQDTAWNSWDTTLSSLTNLGTIADTNGIQAATVEFYESANADGVVPGIDFDTFNTTHPDGFNGVSPSLTRTSSPTGSYPYVGKSAVARGQDGGETLAPAPSGVFDLQMHTPNNDNLTVASFTAPLAGTYTLTNLAARTLLPWSSGSTLKVFNTAGAQIASVFTSSLAWTQGTDISLGQLQAGDKVYFGLDREADFFGDSVETSWTISLEP